MKRKKIIALLSFLFVFSLVLTGCHISGKPQTAKQKSKKQSFIVSTLHSIPSKNISKTDGFYCNYFIYGGTPSNYRLKFQLAIIQIQAKGMKMGANAFINMRVTDATAALQGSEWNSSIVNICGDFVKF
ncbi:MAG: hypothetical protein EVG15_02690 [Candidatus Acididesulfobacter diazotrophicus]|jgi:uncharacterized protein YbjQ (UPF0145 family)|uniref:Lipoprotein n=1 Tax=Candidatus Acididesulfobacter diazotrophicus TaxID=2597226 RepID=A0A519BP38_9DELT|nr:MAG: hypothetical protein EVG15_02690 [Candidatus Acididesulfobacter diazotrophicus]